jgi:hypothetical protein
VGKRQVSYCAVTHCTYGARYQYQHGPAALQPEQVIVVNRYSKEVLLFATENVGVV